MKRDEMEAWIQEWLKRYHMTEESIYKLVLDSYLNNIPVKLGQPMHAPVAYGKDGIILAEINDEHILEAGTQRAAIDSDGTIHADWINKPLTEYAQSEYSKRYLYEFEPGKLYLDAWPERWGDSVGVYIRWAIGF